MNRRRGTGAHLAIRPMGDNVLGVRLEGDPLRPEPIHFRVTFPGGDVDVVRTTTGDHWVHVRVNRRGAPSHDPEQPSARIADGRLDLHDRPVSDSRVGATSATPRSTMPPCGSQSTTGSERSAAPCRHGLRSAAVCALCIEERGARQMRRGGARARPDERDAWPERLLRERRRSAPLRSRVGGSEPRRCAECGLPSNATPCEGCRDLMPCPRCGLPSSGEICLPCSRLDHVGAPDAWLREGLEALRAEGRRLGEWAVGRSRGRFRIPGGLEHACRLLVLAERRARARA